MVERFVMAGFVISGCLFNDHKYLTPHSIILFGENLVSVLPNIAIISKVIFEKPTSAIVHAIVEFENMFYDLNRWNCH